MDDCFFTSAGFEIDATGEDGKFVQINFRDTEDHFIILESVLKRSLTEVDQILNVVASPGDYAEVDRKVIHKFEEFLDHLRDWTERLKKEVLLADIFHTRLEAFRIEIEQRLNESIPDASAHFSAEERAEIMAKLRELDERIKALEKDNPIEEREGKNLEQAIRDLAKATHTMPKRAWYRTAWTKFYGSSLKLVGSKPAQTALEQVIKHLLDAPKT